MHSNVFSSYIHTLVFWNGCILGWCSFSTTAIDCELGQQHSEQPSVWLCNLAPKCFVFWSPSPFFNLNACICQVVRTFNAWYFINKSLTAPLRDAKLSMCSGWLIHRVREFVRSFSLSLRQPIVHSYHSRSLSKVGWCVELFSEINRRRKCFCFIG